MTTASVIIAIGRRPILPESAPIAGQC